MDPSHGVSDVEDRLARLDTAAAPPLPALTDEDVAAVLTQLPLSQLPACAATCLQWARCVRDDGLLWRAVFANHFGGVVAPADARQACRRCLSTVHKLRLQPCSRSIHVDSPTSNLSPRAGEAVGPLGPYVVLSGGATTGFEVTRSLDLWDPRTRRVVARGADRTGRWQHSALSSGDELWLYGGTDTRSHRPCSGLHALFFPARPDAAAGPGLGLGVDGQEFGLGCREVRLEAELQDKDRPIGGPEAGQGAVDEPGPEGQRWAEGPPALAGHTVCALLGGGTAGAAMLVFGGQRRAQSVAAQDPVTNLLWRATLPPRDRRLGSVTGAPSRWSTVRATGLPPSPRYCHSSERVGEGWLIMFGWAKPGVVPRAADERALFNALGRQPFLNDLHRLRLDTMTWETLAPTGAVPRGRCQVGRTTSTTTITTDHYY